MTMIVKTVNKTIIILVPEEFILSSDRGLYLSEEGRGVLYLPFSWRNHCPLVTPATVVAHGTSFE